nr:hypothetical protein Iba_chr03cCG8600 [Ipomoea batatas]GMC82217.1 hypothetical protein Iba_chr04bCG11330 [Ipomoea batatas]GME12207.1 hypothetical protein Iba_scaffold13492CG0270 [Ipomoea batatas]
MGLDSSTSPVTDSPLFSFEVKAKAVNTKSLTEFKALSRLSLSSLASGESPLTSGSLQIREISIQASSS